MSGPAVAEKPPPPASAHEGFAPVGALQWCLVAVIAVATLARFVCIGSVPGINGDEAWYGLLAYDLVHGDAQSWRTPTGLLPNPVHMIPLVLAELAGLHGPATLRLPAVLSGVAAPLVLWFGLCRPLGRRTALCIAAAAATLPAHLAYSRYGFDAAHTPLMIALTLVCALHRRWALTALAAVVALWVHPTNVFGLLAVAVLVGGAAPELRARLSWRWAAAAGLGLVAVAVAVVMFAPARHLPNAGAAFGRLVDPSLALQTWVAFGRLINGLTVSAAIAGPPTKLGAWVLDGVWWLLVIGIGAPGLWLAARRRDARTMAAVAGVVLALLAVLFAAGPAIFMVFYERYGLSLTVPTLVAGVLLARAAMGERYVAAGLGVALLGAVVWAMFYLVPLMTTGGFGHPSFWSGTEDPKLVTWRHIQTLEATSPGPVVIVFEDWWTEKPIRYFARGTQTGVTMNVVNAENARGLFEARFRKDQTTLYVGMADSDLARAAATMQWGAPDWTAPRRSGQPAVVLWRYGPPGEPRP